MHAIPGLDQVLGSLIHKLRPSLQHQDDVELRLMLMPAGAFFGRGVGLDHLRDDAPADGGGDSQIAIYLGFGEIRVYAPRVGVAAGAKPKGYPDFGEIRV